MKKIIVFALAATLTLGSLFGNENVASAADTGSADASWTRSRPDPRQDNLAALMQKIDAVCAEPSSAACAAALSQIEPCGNPQASREVLASAGGGPGACAGKADSLY